MTTGIESTEGERPAVFAGQGGTGQRIAWAAAVLFVPAAVVVPALLVRAGIAGSGVCLIALVSPVLGLYALYFAVCARRAELTGDGLLTARTVSGRRTVDLGRLVRVRRIEIGGRGRATDQLVLTDAHGTRMAVDRLADGGLPDAAVAAAVASAAAAVTVSARAAARLHTKPTTAPADPHPDRHAHAGTHAGGRRTGPGLLRSALLYPVGGLLVTALGIALLFASLVVAGVV